VIPRIISRAALAGARPARAGRALLGTRAAWFAQRIFATIELQYAYYALTMSG
jgi:hypothetical protein